MDTSEKHIKYIGRFAPSPTGPLHFGSLVCALGSYLDARAHGGQWLVRMEDLDPPREEPGAAERILQSLDAHGLHGHGPVAWQSRRHDLYARTLEDLAARDEIYPCHCSRAQIRAAGGHDNLSCRNGLIAADADNGAQALRLRIAGASASEEFHDLWRGQLRQTIDEDTILKRRDGLFAYQLAVVVDDIDQGVTHVVRGADLLDCTGAQQYLFRLLSAAPPQFGHLPLVMGPDGHQKLSKQNHAPALDDARARENLCSALGFLGFHPPAELRLEQPPHILAWAGARWRRQQVDKRDRQLR